MEGLVYTPSSMLKKVFREGERSLSRQELQNRLQNTHETSLITLQLSAEQVIEQAVADELSPFHIGGSHAVIEIDGVYRDHIADELVRYFLETKAPLTREQCLKKLRRNNLVSYSYDGNKLPLFHDARFVQFNGSDLWYLSRWNVANDEIYSYLTDRGIKQLPIAQLHMIVEHELGLSRREFVFVPEGDPRFRVIDGLVIVSYTDEINHDENKEKSAVQINQHEEEVAVTMANDVKTASIWEDILCNAQDSIEKVEQRIKEMEEEVLDHFKQNNMAAISQLVAEKEKNESIVKALEKVMELVNA
ncbi:hypothetical protein [Aneurinibacillus terranovensis]|uniref:hypothetical protein n=1 Tax=Aneurinibacillus terranovensis TaxID=278991 RepID=UPI000401FE64|nr:hypothetical protein [Aneurinibacillus terranovensis]